MPRANRQRPFNLHIVKQLALTVIVRHADDLVAGFEHEEDARRFLDAMRERSEAFALTLHLDTTRLIEFGRYAADRAQRGFGRPETFNFLGFTYICGRSRRGRFRLRAAG